MTLAVRRNVFFLVLAGAVIAAVAAIAIARAAGWFGFGGEDTGPIYTGLVEGTAVGGYDPVAYFTQGRAVEGSPAIVFRYRGAQWRFSSEANRAAFEADPQRYAPAFGGYCAWAVAQGSLARGNPANWDIIDGTLYLNYDDSVQTRWRTDISGFIKKARNNWPDLAGR
jgi:YHS domain-containing protein